MSVKKPFLNSPRKIKRWKLVLKEASGKNTSVLDEMFVGFLDSVETVIVSKQISSWRSGPSTAPAYKTAKLLQRLGFDCKRVEGSLSGSQPIGFRGGQGADRPNRRVGIRVPLKQNGFAKNGDLPTFDPDQLVHQKDLVCWTNSFMNDICLFPSLSYLHELLVK
jgi:hypothetical protein